MPGFPFPGRPGGEHDEPLLDMIFGGRALPPDAPPEVHDLAWMLAAAAGPAEPGELAGEAAARAAFRFASPACISPVIATPSRRRPRRPAPSSTRRPGRRAARRAARTRARFATALVVVAAGLGSAAAAYIGVLPGPIQNIAHATVGAPAPHRDIRPGAAAPGLVPNGRPRPAARHAAQGHSASGASGQAGQARPAKPDGQGPATRRCPLISGQDPASPSLRSACCPGPVVPTAEHDPALAHGKDPPEMCRSPVRVSGGTDAANPAGPAGTGR